MQACVNAVCALALLAGCHVSSGPASAEGAPGAWQGISLKLREDCVDALLDGRPLTSFHFHSQWDKPFLYPIRTVSGIVVSRGWPVEPRAGEQKDYLWYPGIWYGHGDINGEDFWREKPDQTTSRLVVASELMFFILHLFRLE